MHDPKTENYLTSSQYSWERVMVPFAEIDMKASKENPARLTRHINEEVVFEYALAMEAGVPFPAIVLLRLDPGARFKYIVATGMHRISAAQEVKIDKFDAYIVTEPDQYRRDVLVRQLNMLEGQNMTLRDKLAQVLQLHDMYPAKSLNMLAQEWHLKPSTVHNAAKEQRAGARARKFNYDFVKAKVHQKVVMALDGIHSDKVFERACQFVIQNAPSSSEVDSMVGEIKKIRDEQAAIDIVGQYAKASTDALVHQQAKNGRISPAAATRLISSCRTVNRMIDKGIEQLHLSTLTKPDHAIIVVQELITALKRVASELERIQRIKETSIPLITVPPKAA